MGFNGALMVFDCPDYYFDSEHLTGMLHSHVRLLEARIRRDNVPLLLDIHADRHHIHNASKRFCKSFDWFVEGLFNDIYNDHKWSVDLREPLVGVCTLIGVKFAVLDRFISHR